MVRTNGSGNVGFLMDLGKETQASVDILEGFLVELKSWRTTDAEKENTCLCFCSERGALFSAQCLCEHLWADPIYQNRVYGKHSFGVKHMVSFWEYFISHGNIWNIILSYLYLQNLLQLGNRRYIAFQGDTCLNFP